MTLSPQQTLAANIHAAQTLFQRLHLFAEPLAQAAHLLQQALTQGHKILACGNGGSASQSAHFTAEFTGRYQLPRPGFPALDLTGEHALLTALINDYPPDEVFARQVRALGCRGDVLVVFTTSGASRNIVLALQEARSRGIASIAFLGRDGGACGGLADVEMIVPSQVTARIQECHALLYHTLCEVLDPILAEHAHSRAT